MNHELLVKALRRLLEVPVEERRVTELDGTAWDDSELVEVLSKFEETGGFPAEYTGAENQINDIVANGRFKGDELEFVHEELRKELDAGWCVMFEREEDIPWEGYRTSPLFTAVKKKNGQPKRDSRGRIKRRLIDHLS